MFGNGKKVIKKPPCTCSSSMCDHSLSNPLVHFNQISQRRIDASDVIIPCKADQGKGLLRKETCTTDVTEGRMGSTHCFSRLSSSETLTQPTGLPGHLRHTGNPAELVKGCGKYLGIAKEKV